jgi:ABC-type branched-subunit amino acid transport system substrate-binding protein
MAPHRLSGLRTVLALLATGLAFLINSPAVGASRSKVTKVKIGLIVPTTGPLASGGEEIIAGSKAAEVVWNKTHRNLKAGLAVCNSQGTAAGGLGCVYQLEGSVDAIAGPDFSTDFPGALPALEEAHKFVASLEALEEPPANSSIFVAQPSITSAVPAMMTHFKSEGYKRIGLLVDQEPSGTGAVAIATSFAKKHGMSVSSASFADSDTTAVPALQTVLSSKPQAILVWVIGNAGQTVLRAISTLNVSTPVVMNYFNVSTALFGKAALPSDTRVSVLGSRQFLQGNENAIRMFNEAYTASIHEPPSWPGSVAGNAVDLIMYAAEGAGGTAYQKMSHYVEHRASPIDGPAINMEFSSKNHVAAAPAGDWAFLRYNPKNNSWLAG